MTAHPWPVVALGWVGLVVASVQPAVAQERPGLDAGVFTETQARAGEAVYGDACAECHGASLEGRVGPPLAGEAFLGVWSARPVSDLVTKIHATMPPQAPTPLSRTQALDLTAFVLEATGFSPGDTVLVDAMAGDLSFPTVEAPAAAAGDRLPPPTANLAQLMRAISFPASNTIFNIQIRAPDAEPPPATGTRSFDYVQWGSTVYPGWQAVDLAALALIESTPLFLTPGRRCENGRPVPVEQDDWRQYTDALVEVGRTAYRASQTRDVDAMIGVAEQLDLACNTCHQVYRDVGLEGRGEGADRCRLPSDTP